MTQFNLDLINKWPTFGWPLSSTSIAALSVYAVGGFDPKLALDFIGNTYRTGGADSTLADSITHARAGHATMVDSDGLIKRAPHNLLIRSEELNLWGQTGAGGVVVDNAVAPDGTTTAATFTISSTNFNRYIRSFSTYKAGDIITFSFWVRSDTVTTLPFGINGGANGANNPIFGSLTVTSTWQLFEFEFTILGNDTSLYYMIGKQYNNPVNCQLGDVEIWHPHVYRSDLGGMANNSATGDSYVPTTSSPVYLPRVGHHIYNGNAWVNEGILHESEARTNLFSNSNTAVWSNNSTTSIINSGVSPDGTSNATKVVPYAYSPSVGISRFVYAILQSNSGVKSSTSIYLASAGYGFATVCAYNAGNYSTAVVDLSNGTIGDIHVAGSVTDTFTVEPAGNNFYRVSVTHENRSVLILGVSDTGTYTPGQFGFNSTWSSDGVSGILRYGLQHEIGSTPSSYIPTSGSAVTRAAETLTVPAANLPYSSTNMSIQMDGKMTYADNDLFPNTLGIFGDVGFLDWRNPTFDFISAGINTGASRLGEYDVYQRSTTSGVQVTQGATSDYSPDINVPFHIASIHSSTFIKGATEGTLTTSLFPTNQGLPDLSSTDLNLGHIFMGTIGKFRVWDEDLGDTGIATASSPSTEPSLQLTFDGSSTNSFTVLDWSE